MSFLALFCSVFVSMIQLVPDSAKVYQDGLKYLLLLVPQVAIAQALLGQSWFWTPQRGYTDPTFRANDRSASVWALPVTGLSIIYLLFSGILWFSLVLLIDAWKSNALPTWCTLGKGAPSKPETPSNGDASTTAGFFESASFYQNEDEDVQEERHFCEACDVETADEDLPPILLKNLRKVFTARGTKMGSKQLCFWRRKGQRRRRRRVELKPPPTETPKGPIVAVRDLCFSVPKGQCFGFLGVNGAGKTTTIQMLSGAIQATKGSALLCGRDVTQNVRSVWKEVGYCPQFDALFPYLTVKEHLYFYARLAGVKDRSSKELVLFVNRILETLGIPEKANSLSRHLSGGQQRKLSVGLAFLKNPGVVFLDEPSSGVDPASRRKLWNLIAESTATSGRAVILTTHSMEECEALCDRLAIMQGGRLLCIGPPSHLKARFGQGFQLEVTFRDTFTRTPPPPSSPSGSPKLEHRSSKYEAMASLGTGIQALNNNRRLNSKMNSPSPLIRRDLAACELEEESVDVVLGLTMTMDSFHEFMNSEFDGLAEETERLGRHSRWMIPKSAVDGLASLFKIIEARKEALRIQDYAVSEASLEAIFVQFQNKAQLEQG